MDKKTLSLLTVTFFSYAPSAEVSGSPPDPVDLFLVGEDRRALADRAIDTLPEALRAALRRDIGPAIERVAGAPRNAAAFVADVGSAFLSFNDAEVV